MACERPCPHKKTAVLPMKYWAALRLAWPLGQPFLFSSSGKAAVYIDGCSYRLLTLRTSIGAQANYFGLVERWGKSKTNKGRRRDAPRETKLCPYKRPQAAYPSCVK